MSETKQDFSAAAGQPAPAHPASAPVRVAVTDGFNTDATGRDAWGRDVRNWIQTTPGGSLRPHP